jgi:hypothetical protein
LWGAPTETLENLFDSKSNKTIFKDFKLQITNGCNTPIQTLIFFISGPIFSSFKFFLGVIFTIMSASNEGLQYLLKLQMKPQKKLSKTVSVQP